jgi:hypothetical protein
LDVVGDCKDPPEIKRRRGRKAAADPAVRPIPNSIVDHRATGPRPSKVTLATLQTLKLKTPTEVVCCLFVIGQGFYANDSGSTSTIQSTVVSVFKRPLGVS